MKNLKKLQHSKLRAVLPYFLLPVISSHFLPFSRTCCRRFTRTFYKCCCLQLATVVHTTTCTLSRLSISDTKLVSLLAVIVFSKVLPVTVAVW